MKPICVSCLRPANRFLISLRPANRAKEIAQWLWHLLYTQPTSEHCQARFLCKTSPVSTSGCGPNPQPQTQIETNDPKIGPEIQKSELRLLEESCQDTSLWGSPAGLRSLLWVTKSGATSLDDSPPLHPLVFSCLHLSPLD